MRYDIKRVMSDHVAIRKCGVGEDIGDGKRGVPVGDGQFIELPTDYSQRTNFGELIVVGPECKHFDRSMEAVDEYNGVTVWVPESSADQVCIDPDTQEYFIYREKDIPPVLFDDNTVRPLGEMVLVMLDTNAAHRVDDQEDEVKISEYSVRPTGIGTLVKVGDLPPKDCKVGDSIVLTRGANMLEFDYKHHTYGVVSRREIAAVKKD